ncbi:double-strand break repair helicase AddA [Hyphomonas johnsonii]|uniref:DNA 3'-5' helicase n=1 Tax=Hyphomonas johnsonii MHS-2 TaxID=1280950 RepID=A0A059FRH5_9PROT|nr:double-strand break repair helicase AddA [Hyphomonas johnsonii]KCZ93285.1 double-strand break repair helicase AddA [Hyphomonas johnsonii MHS-2]
MPDPNLPVYERDEAADYVKATDVQARVADPAVPAFVSANAGSGKTKVLIDRVARLLLRREDGRPGAAPDSILCITYTKAAASEMLSRLFKTLGRWSVMEDDRLRRELAKLEGREGEAYTPDDLKAARALFARALESPGGLRIETIHAFCSRILRRFPLEAGVLPGFTEIEEDEAARLWNTARADAVLAAKATAPGLLDLLSLEGGHDGAMSGLDTLRWSQGAVLDFAEAHDFDFDAMDIALREGLNAPEASAAEIIALAMGEALPTGDLRAAVALLQGGGKSDEKTADALVAVLAETDPAARWETYLGIFTTAAGDFRKSNPYTAGVAKQSPLVADLFQMKDGEGRETARVRDTLDHLSRALAFERTSALLRVGLPALLAYQKAKAARAALDFDDLIHKTRLLLTQSGMADWVLYKLDGGLSHVLLDEAQDTSPAQWQLVTALTEEFFAGKGQERQQDPRTLFVVGDEKQSIYSFQGADPSKFREKAQEFSLKSASLLLESMDMSFRSAPEVLAFVDTVWNGAPVIDAPEAGDAPMVADKVVHTARRASQPGSVELWPIAPKAEDPDADAWDRPVNAMRESSPKAKLAKALATQLKTMVDRGDTVWVELPDHGWVRRPIEPQDILVLVRGRTGGLFDAMIGALKSAGLPVAGADRLKLLDHIGVQDCLNLLRFVVLPEDDLTLAEIIRGPFLGLVDDDRYLYELAQGRAKKESLWQRVEASADPDVMAAADFLRSLQARAHMAPYEFLSSVMDQAGADGMTGWEKINARLGAPARDPVEALMARALQHDAADPASLQGFLVAMEAHDTEIKRDLAAPEREVRVMTVHGAKGLQAPVVVLPDTTAGPKGGSAKVFDLDGVPVWSPRKDTDTPQLAAARAIADAKAEEEHRRLLYVALTRAQDRLIIAGHWHGRGEDGCHKGSWYALCAAAMDALAPGGDADAVRRYGAPATQMGSEDAAGTRDEQLPDWALQRAPTDSPARKLSAPTSLLSRKTPLLAPFGSRREAQLRRGRLIHALLQYLPELPQDEREAAGRAYLAREGDLEDGQRDEMLRAAMGVLTDPAMAGVFAPGGRAEAAIIGTADALPKGTIINGRVDRLVVTPERVLVIDFKTDQPAPDSVDGVAETYMAQMAAYWAVLKRAYPGRDVVAALCWTDGPKLMVLPEADLLASLNRAQSEV